MESKSPKEICKNFSTLMGNRSNWESYWQTLHDYFYVESSNINRSYYSGTELDFTYLWDATSLETADILANGFMNYLTPPSSKWFNLRTKNPELMEKKPIALYLEDVRAECYHALNNSNFYNQMFSNYKASGVYGTSIFLAEEDFETDIRFYALPVKQVCIVENASQRIKEFYILFEYTAYQAIQRFGRNNVSIDIGREYDTGRDENRKYQFILYIAQRHRRDLTKIDNKNMPVMALWIEKDKMKLVQEGGYSEMPAMAHRFEKRPFEVYGFSPAMKALPDVRTLNLEAKTVLRSQMKNTDPAVAVPENAFIMPFNANPRAVNYYSKDAMTAKDIFAFGNYGNPYVGMEAMEAKRTHIKALMYTDVFLAFEGVTKQMNNPEVYERINEKMTMLAPSVGRFISDVLNPIITRTIGVLARRGKLPPVPDEMLADGRYEIEYVSQLAQAQKRTELNSLTNALGLVGQVSQFKPEVLDKINGDKAVDDIWGITGASPQVLRDDQEVADIRAARAEAAAEQQKLDMAAQLAQTAETATRADKNISQSQIVQR